MCVCIIIYTNNTFKIKITMNKCYSLEVPGKRIIQLNNLKIEKVATYKKYSTMRKRSLDVMGQSIKKNINKIHWPIYQSFTNFLI